MHNSYRNFSLVFSEGAPGTPGFENREKAQLWEIISKFAKHIGLSTNNITQLSMDFNQLYTKHPAVCRALRQLNRSHETAITSVSLSTLDKITCTRMLNQLFSQQSSCDNRYLFLIEIVCDFRGHTQAWIAASRTDDFFPTRSRSL